MELFSLSKSSCSEFGCTQEVRGRGLCLEHFTAGCSKPVRAREMCDTHYTEWHREQPKCITPGCRRMMKSKKRCRIHEPLELTAGKSEHKQQKWLAKFRQNIEPDPRTECWVWTGPMNPKGYGLHQAGSTWLAHRYSYAWFVGSQDQGKVLDHLCTVKLCVRPDHLLSMPNTSNVSLEKERAFMVGVDFFKASWITPRYPKMIEWAKANGLPWKKLGALPFQEDWGELYEFQIWK